MNTRRLLRLAPLTATLLAGTVIVSPAWAVMPTYTWNVGGGGSWGVANNWNPTDGPPNASNEIDQFTNAGGYTIDLSGGPFLLDELVVGTTDAITFTGGSLNFTGSPDARINANTNTNLDNSTTLQFGQSGTIDVANGKRLTSEGTINVTGTAATGGGLTKAGLGYLSINQVNGDILVSDGTLDLGKGPVSGTHNLSGTVTGLVDLAGGTSLDVYEPTGGDPSVGALSGSGDVVFEEAANLHIGSDNESTTYSGVISQVVSAGSITKEGTGTLTLTGASTYTGPTTVNDGKLVVNGSLVSIVTVTSGTLGGSGAVGGLVLNSGGAVAPGNSPGTLAVNGNVTFNAGSFYDVEADAAGVSDKIAATGTATLNGGTVRVAPAPGAYSPSTIYTILTATGGLTGTFGGVTSSLAFLTPTLSYDANDAYLTLTRNAVNFATMAATPNQRAAAAAAQQLGSGSAVYNGILSLTGAAAPAAFDSLSGEIYPSAETALIQDSQMPRDTAFGRLGELEQAQIPGKALWGQIYGNSSSIAGDGNYARLNTSTGGIAAGLDGVVNDWKLGAMLHYGTTNLSVPDRASTGSSADAGVGVYGGTRWGDTSLRLGADYTNHGVTSSRSVTLPGYTDGLAGSYGASTTQAFAELSQHFDLGKFGLDPFGLLAVVNQQSDAFTETGGAAALHVAGYQQTLALTTLGLRGRIDLPAGEHTLALTGEAGWRHAFANQPTSQNSFAGGAAFTIAGTSVPADTLTVGAGLGTSLGGGTLDLNYRGEFGTAESSNSVSATFSGKW